MPKKRLQQWLPKPEKLRQNKMINVFAPFLADPKLWYMNRSYLARAIYIGSICAFIPLPGQTPLALLCALLLRANIPMSVALTWLTNPLTAIPVYWVAYCVGAILLGEPTIGIRTIGIVLTDITLWLTADGDSPFLLHQHVFSFKVFLLGLTITAIITSILLGIAFNLFWRYHTTKDWKKRQGYQAHAPKFRTQKTKKPSKR